MASPAGKVATCDPIWSAMRDQAKALAGQEPALASFVHATILNHDRLEDALSYHLAKKIGGDDVSPMLAREIFVQAIADDPSIGEAVRADLAAVYDRDPACHSHVQAFLFFKGFHALECHRISHWLWRRGREGMALFFQSRISELFDVDVHPGARMGRGIMIDHATGVVIGETAVVEDDVSIMHGVTLGGTGKEAGDRHPKIRHGVLIGAGAKILGNIEIGHCARIAAGSVVLKPVPHNTTVAGVPAKVIGEAGCPEPSRFMDQMLHGLDL
jgi:serine O-acetyltransferase